MHQLPTGTLHMLTFHIRTLLKRCLNMYRRHKKQKKMHTQCKKSLYCVICTNWIVEENFFRTISGNGNMINLPKLWFLKFCNIYSAKWMIFLDCRLVLVKMIEVFILSRTIEKTFIVLLVSIIGNQLRLWIIHIDHVLTFKSHVWRFNFSLWTVNWRAIDCLNWKNCFQ